MPVENKERKTPKTQDCEIKVHFDELSPSISPFKRWGTYDGNSQATSQSFELFNHVICFPFLSFHLTKGECASHTHFLSPFASTACLFHRVPEPSL